MTINENCIWSWFFNSGHIIYLNRAYPTNVCTEPLGRATTTRVITKFREVLWHGTADQTVRCWIGSCDSSPMARWKSRENSNTKDRRLSSLASIFPTYFQPFSIKGSPARDLASNLLLDLVTLCSYNYS